MKDHRERVHYYIQRAGQLRALASVMHLKSPRDALIVAAETYENIAASVESLAILGRRPPAADE